MSLPSVRAHRAPLPNGTIRHAPSAYVYGRPQRLGWLRSSVSSAAAALLVSGLAGHGIKHQQQKQANRRKNAGVSPASESEMAARQLHHGAALLAFSVLADSTLEHYRGNFKHRAMFIAPAVAGVSLATLLHNGAHPRAKTRKHTTVYGLAATTGAVGFGFHVYNLWRREGRFSWTNLFYGAPLGAPGAISIAGILGLMAQRLVARQSPQAGAQTLLGLPSGKVLGAFTSCGLLGNAAEAWLLHFRGAFQNPFMYLPAVLPPAAALSLAFSTFKPSGPTHRLSRLLLVATAAMGAAGVGFHAYGITRNMGGWRNWSQIVLQGPPLPAPPSFTGMALAALGALRLIREKR